MRGERIVGVGKLSRSRQDRIVDMKGLVVAPGFIDAHSHADGKITTEPTAISQVTQGITTAVVGQDGGWQKPFAERGPEIMAVNPSINFAYFAGLGGIRKQVMGNDYKRAATDQEVAKMAEIVEQEMKFGALGVSTGLEYDPGHYSTTEELISLSKVAAKHGGLYISHVRDEGNGAIGAFEEVIRIGKEAKIPVQVSHIKLGTFPVWGKAGEVVSMFQKARMKGVDITADIYPYTYWYSGITALTVSRDFESVETWRRGLEEVGGGKNVLLTSYTADPSLEGKTIAEIAAQKNRPEPEVVKEIVMNSQGEEQRAAVVVTAMSQPDLETFVGWKHTMFCSDGQIGGAHPRGAGSYPRILHLLTKPNGKLTMQEAIRKMTSAVAKRFKIRKRGVIKKGYFADIVAFDPKEIRDYATPQNSTVLSKGVRHVFVNGVHVLQNETVIGRGGKLLFRGR